MRQGYRFLAVALAGASIFIGIHFVRDAAWAGLFEVDNPSLFARSYYTWSVLTSIVPGLVVGCFAARRVVSTTLLAYGLGYLILIAANFRSDMYDVPDSITWWRVALAMLRELAPPPLTGVAVALIVAYLRRMIIARLRRGRPESA
jgi:hypothetical protein